MTGHIHLSVVSAATFGLLLLVWSYIYHQLALRLGSSQNENTAQWGQALAAGFGFA